MEMTIGFLIGLLIMWAGQLVRTKQALLLIAGYQHTWEPVDGKKLSNRVGILVMIVGLLAMLTSIFTIWFGVIVAKITGVLVLIDALFIFIVILLDQMGY